MNLAFRERNEERPEEKEKGIASEREVLAVAGDWALFCWRTEEIEERVCRRGRCCRVTVSEQGRRETDERKSALVDVFLFLDDRLDVLLRDRHFHLHFSLGLDVLNGLLDCGRLAEEGGSAGGTVRKGEKRGDKNVQQR